MSIPKEPRQQMINIMYLVLIAMLALSVSSEILNAFKIVNRGIDKANGSLEDRTTAMLSAFEGKVAEEGGEEAKPYFESAQKANAVTDEFVKYINDLTSELKEASGTDEKGELSKPDDQDTPSRIMISEGKAKELEAKIKETRAKYLQIFSKYKTTDKEGYKKDTAFLAKFLTLDAPPPPEDDEKTEWADYTFYQMPAAGALTLLNQIENDARSSGVVAIQRLANKIDIDIKPEVNLDKYKAIAFPTSSKVEQGGQVEVRVFLSTPEGNPTANIGGQKVAIGPNGYASYTANTSEIGRQKVGGNLIVLDDKGKPKTIKFNTAYDVVAKKKEKDVVPRAELDAAKKRIKELEEELRRLKERMKNMIDKDKIPKDLTLEVKKLQDELKLVKAPPKVKDLSKELAQARAELAETRKKLTDALAEIKRLKDLMKNMIPKPKEEIPDLRKPLADAKKEIKRLEELMKTMEPKRKDKPKDFPDLRKPLADAKTEIKRLEDLMKTMEPKRKDKPKDFPDLRKPLADAKKEIKRLEELLKTMEPKRPPRPKDETPILKDKIKKLQEELRKKPKVVTTTKEVDPQGVVSPDKMNVFYIGVDNPVSLSVSGASIDDVKASIDNGQLKGAGRGKYIVTVPGPHNSKTNISLKVGGQVISRNLFRVKRVPDPVPEVGGKAGGVLGTGEMKAQKGLIARLKDFDFDARFEVLGFELTLAEKGQDLLIVPNKGPRFNSKSQQLLKKAKVGSIYYFDNIKVKGPDKTTRKLPSISFKIR